MKAKNFFRITMLVVIAAFVLAQCTKDDPEPEKKPAKLETVSNLSFEGTEVGKSTSKKVTITNSGELVLKVSNISLEGTDKAAFDTDGVAKDIQPGKSYQFKVTFSPKSEGDNTANLKIVSNGGNATVALSGKATPKPVATFAITPETKDFGEIEVNKTAEQEFTITNGGTAELELKSFVLTGTNKDEFSTNGTATKVAAGKTQTFKVTFAPKTVGDKTATLTITSNLGEHKVTLSGKAKAAIIAVTGVTVKDKTSIVVDESETLTAMVSPATATNQNVTWKSSDETIATVDNTGEVTAVAEGTATITITTEDGSHTATCEVTVTSTTTSKITFTTKKAAGKNITLITSAADADRAGVWIDLNNNGTKDSGEAVTTFDDWKSYELGSQTVTIYGEVTMLTCQGNQLTALDVSKNTALTELICHYNQLTALDVSKNTALTELFCRNNQLTALDVSKNTALTSLVCYNNQLTALDVSKNTALTELICSKNQLTALDVSKNTKLSGLYCLGNQLTDLDVSANTALKYLNCNNNQLTALDVSKNTKLSGLYCSDNQLTDLDVSANTVLKYLDCGDNQLTALNVANGNNGAITILYATNNPSLTCIKVDKDFTPSTWNKDDTATYRNDGTDCP